MLDVLVLFFLFPFSPNSLVIYFCRQRAAAEGVGVTGRWCRLLTGDKKWQRHLAGCFLATLAAGLLLRSEKNENKKVNGAHGRVGEIKWDKNE